MEWIRDIGSWLNDGNGPWVLGIGLLATVVSFAVVLGLLLLLPPRYCVDEHRFWANKPPLARCLGAIAKNLLGLVVVVIGVVLSLPGIPGPGLVIILIGVILLDIPGKRRLIHAITRQRWIQRTINSVRMRFGRPPLLFEK